MGQAAAREIGGMVSMLGPVLAARFKDLASALRETAQAASASEILDLTGDE